MFFIFRLLTIFYKDLIFITPIFLFFIFFWSFFIKNNFLTVKINPNSNDVLSNFNPLKKIHYHFLINWSLIQYFYVILYYIILKLDFNSFWFNHFKINNFNFNLILIIFFLSFFIINITKFLKNSNVNYNIDYFSSIINLIIFVPLIFLSSNMYTFLFILELISLIILYKFSVSRTWFNNLLSNNKINFNRILPKSFLNMFFFQYWANFFSSMLIMFSIFNLFFFTGSTEWFFLNSINLNSNYFFFNINSIFIYIWFSFFLGLFLKIGLTPIHLFKIEVYKGIPFISIFFYTTWYFLSFFLYFVVILYFNIFNIKQYFNFFIFIFINIGIFYAIFLLFDVNLLKSFFAYSTIVNVLNFVIVIFLILN